MTPTYDYDIEKFIFMLCVYYGIPIKLFFDLLCYGGLDAVGSLLFYVSLYRFLIYPNVSNLIADVPKARFLQKLPLHINQDAVSATIQTALYALNMAPLYLIDYYGLAYWSVLPLRLNNLLLICSMVVNVFLVFFHVRYNKQSFTQMLQYRGYMKTNDEKNEEKKKKEQELKQEYTTPTYISTELADFMGLSTDSMITPFEVVRFMEDYVNLHNLTTNGSNMMYKCDDKMQALLKVPSNKQLHALNMLSYLRPHFVSKSKNVYEANYMNASQEDNITTISITREELEAVLNDLDEDNEDQKVQVSEHVDECKQIMELIDEPDNLFLHSINDSSKPLTCALGYLDDLTKNIQSLNDDCDVEKDPEAISCLIKTLHARAAAYRASMITHLKKEISEDDKTMLMHCSTKELKEKLKNSENVEDDAEQEAEQEEEQEQLQHLPKSPKKKSNRKKGTR